MKGIFRPRARRRPRPRSLEVEWPRFGGQVLSLGQEPHSTK
jgi:hypothetical protein